MGPWPATFHENDPANSPPSLRRGQGVVDLRARFRTHPPSSAEEGSYFHGSEGGESRSGSG
jgi:hypothetical protein